MGCVKRYFLTKEEAVKSIEKIHAQDKSKNKKPIRSYKCDKCGKFHLTSMTRKIKNYIDSKPMILKKKKLERQIEYIVKKKGWSDDDAKVNIKKKVNRLDD